MITIRFQWSKTYIQSFILITTNPRHACSVWVLLRVFQLTSTSTIVEGEFGDQVMCRKVCVLHTDDDLTATQELKECLESSSYE